MAKCYCKDIRRLLIIHDEVVLNSINGLLIEKLRYLVVDIFKNLRYITWVIYQGFIMQKECEVQLLLFVSCFKLMSNLKKLNSTNCKNVKLPRVNLYIHAPSIHIPIQFMKKSLITSSTEGGEKLFAQIGKVGACKTNNTLSNWFKISFSFFSFQLYNKRKCKTYKYIQQFSENHNYPSVIILEKKNYQQIDFNCFCTKMKKFYPNLIEEHQTKRILK